MHNWRIRGAIKRRITSRSSLVFLKLNGILIGSSFLSASIRRSPRSLFAYADRRNSNKSTPAQTRNSWFDGLAEAITARGSCGAARRRTRQRRRTAAARRRWPGSGPVPRRAVAHLGGFHRAPSSGRQQRRSRSTPSGGSWAGREVPTGWWGSRTGRRSRKSSRRRPAVARARETAIANPWTRCRQVRNFRQCNSVGIYKHLRKHADASLLLITR